MVDVAQLVRASDCGSEGRGFEPHLPPYKKECIGDTLFFCLRQEDNLSDKRNIRNDDSLMRNFINAKCKVWNLLILR